MKTILLLLTLSTASCSLVEPRAMLLLPKLQTIDDGTQLLSRWGGVSYWHGHDMLINHCDLLRALWPQNDGTMNVASKEVSPHLL